MKAKIFTAVLYSLFLLELFMAIVWLEMLTMNAAAFQYKILIHQTWTATHE